MVDLSVNTINRTTKNWKDRNSTPGSWYYDHAKYGRTIASACFRSFFAKYRGVNSGDTIDNGFNWSNYSGTFECQILKEYQKFFNIYPDPADPSKLTGILHPPTPISGAQTDITVRKIIDFSNTQSAITATSGKTNIYGSAIGITIFNDFFDKKNSIFSPEYNTNDITINLLYDAFSSSLLTYIELTTGSTHNYISGFVKNNNKQITTEEINLNDYINSAATWLFDNFLGFSYIWHGSTYDSNYTGFVANYKQFVPYQYASTNTGSSQTSQNSSWASGWVGNIRTYFHRTMDNLIKNFR